MDAYTGMVTLLLAACVFPAWALFWLLRPKPVRYILRGGDSVIPFVFALDATYRLALILSGQPVVYPGDVWAMVRLPLLGVSALLLWAKLDQTFRHRARNKEFAKQGKAELLERGIDIDAEIAEQQKARKAP